MKVIVERRETRWEGTEQTRERMGGSEDWEENVDDEVAVACKALHSARIRIATVFSHYPVPFLPCMLSLRCLSLFVLSALSTLRLLQLYLPSASTLPCWPPSPSILLYQADTSHRTFAQRSSNTRRPSGTSWSSLRTATTRAPPRALWLAPWTGRWSTRGRRLGCSFAVVSFHCLFLLCYCPLSLPFTAFSLPFLDLSLPVGLLHSLIRQDGQMHKDFLTAEEFGLDGVAREELIRETSRNWELVHQPRAQSRVDLPFNAAVEERCSCRGEILPGP